MQVANALKRRLRYVACVRPICRCHQLDERLFPVRRQQADAAECRDPGRRETKLVSTPTCSRLLTANAPSASSPMTAEDPHPRAEASKRGRDVSSHAARRFLLHDAVHLAVAGRQPIDLDQTSTSRSPIQRKRGSSSEDCSAALKARSSRRR